MGWNACGHTAPVILTPVLNEGLLCLDADQKHIGKTGKGMVSKTEVGSVKTISSEIAVHEKSSCRGKCPGTEFL